MSKPFHKQIRAVTLAVDAELERCLKRSRPQILWDAMAYSVLGGGKRIRPLLCLFACEAVSGSWQAALPAACAVEFIHTYSLIHDDLPALDNDDWRRGKPSNHREFGEDMAILAGDSLLTLAFQTLAQSTSLDPKLQLSVISELALAAGPSGMCAGQVLDMQGADMISTVPQVLEVYRLKTGALIRAAVRMGALLGQANAEQLDALTVYAEQLGQSFQIIDDLLDLTGSLATLGKTPGKDLAQDKRTFPALMGISASEERVSTSLHKALQALDILLPEQRLNLEQMAYLLIERKT